MAIQIFEIETLVRFAGNFQLSAVDIDPTTITVKILEPTLTNTSYVYGIAAEVIKDSVGDYHIDINLDHEGIWYYRWEAVGAAEVQISKEGAVKVKSSSFLNQ